MEAGSPDCRSNVENASHRPASRMRRAVLGAPPVTRRSPAGGARRPRPAGRSHYVVISRDGRKLVTRVRVMLPYSNATRAPIVNLPNSAQLAGSLYHASKLHPGPCSSVGVRPRTDRHTDTQTRVTIHFASSTTHAKCLNIHNTEYTIQYTHGMHKDTRNFIALVHQVSNVLHNISKSIVDTQQ